MKLRAAKYSKMNLVKTKFYIKELGVTNIEEVLEKLKVIERDGIAIEECTNEELIDYIAELKNQINNVINMIENKILF